MKAKNPVKAVEFWKKDENGNGDIKVRYTGGTDDFFPDETYPLALLKAKRAGVLVDVFEIGAK